MKNKLMIKETTEYAKEGTTRILSKRGHNKMNAKIDTVNQ